MKLAGWLWQVVRATLAVAVVFGEAYRLDAQLGRPLQAEIWSRVTHEDQDCN